MYSVDPSYTDEEMLAKIKIPERTFYRHKSQIWNEDAPKREKEEQEYIKRRLQALGNPII